MDLPVNEIVQGDCLEIMKQWPSDSIDCCVTSPPYWGLRDYGLPPTEWPDGSVCCYGLEPTPELYVQHTVLIFREVKRLLKPEGTLWLNLGDSYYGGGWKGSQTDLTGTKQGTNTGTLAGKDMTKDPPHPVIKPKDLCGIPWRVALALQQDGWYLRQDIIWHKPNPMPESVTGRCTKAHEYIFLLTKNPRYYCDMEAIKEKANTEWNAAESWGARMNETSPELSQMTEKDKGLMRTRGFGTHHTDETKTTRNKRSVWTVTTAPYKEAHFATFPPKLIEPCILAGCPEWVCKKCGEARVRIVEKPVPPEDVMTNNRKPDDKLVKITANKYGKGQGQKLQNWLNEHPTQTTGWTDCGCGKGFVPGVCLDPFMGSGTTAMVAYENRRNYVGCELNPEYIKLNRADLAKEKYGLFE